MATTKKPGEQAVATLLNKFAVELNRVTEGMREAGVDVGKLQNLGEEVASVNQGCNGICRSLEDLGKLSEVAVSRAANAAAIYNIRQFDELTKLGKLDVEAASCNQGCNGICGSEAEIQTMGEM